MAQPNLPRDETTGTLDAYAWPGGYPLFYLMRDGEVLCPTCANTEEVHATCDENAVRCAQDNEQWCIVGADANWEDPLLYCVHCGESIESAYADDEVDGSETV